MMSTGDGPIDRKYQQCFHRHGGYRKRRNGWLILAGKSLWHGWFFSLPPWLRKPPYVKRCRTDNYMIHHEMHNGSCFKWSSDKLWNLRYESNSEYWQLGKVYGISLTAGHFCPLAMTFTVCDIFSNGPVEIEDLPIGQWRFSIAM